MICHLNGIGLVYMQPHTLLGVIQPEVDQCVACVAEYDDGLSEYHFMEVPYILMSKVWNWVIEDYDNEIRKWCAEQNIERPYPLELNRIVNGTIMNHYFHALGFETEAEMVQFKLAWNSNDA